MRKTRTAMIPGWLGAGLVLGLVLGSVAAPHRAAAQEEVDREFLVLLNEERAKVGAAPLRFHRTPQRWADRWTWRMIEAGRLSHQNLTHLVRGRILQGGENVGVNTGGVADIVEGFMASPGHRDNILDPAYTHVGISTRTGPFEGSDATWTTHVFVRIGDR